MIHSDVQIDSVVCGDALETLRTMESNSIDALVCDPPSGIHFMARSWDHDKGGRDAWIAWLASIMQEAKRCLKPGAHALVWALPRTSHWTATALEDAGFEIRDKLFHLFGSGFPKSKNLGNGVGSALKPAVEEWILARKPLSERSLEANYAKWGVGGLNIDGCRVGLNGMEHHETPGSGAIGTAHGIYHSSKDPINRLQIARAEQGLNPRYDPQGRFPSHLLLSHTLLCDENECFEGCPILELSRQSGPSKSKMASGVKRGNGVLKFAGHNARPSTDAYLRESEQEGYNDQGTAARFFQQFHPATEIESQRDMVPYIYAPKASRAERNRGCEGLPVNEQRSYNHIQSKWIVDARSANGGYPASHSAPLQNSHPTVKSLQLMRYLVRLITPPGGIVLDCFCGSGSTLVASVYEGMRFVGIDQSEEYCQIARARVQFALQHAQMAGDGP